ncbi:DUF7691 family protein [Kitasatospora sp. NPDC054939]
MSHVITLLTADRNEILSYLGGAEQTGDRKRIADRMRERARAYQDSLDRHGVDWGLSVPDALEHLFAGRADERGGCAGNAYWTALWQVISSLGSDTDDLGVYSKPSTFFGLLQDELRGLGVPADLLPHDFLYAGPPDEVPFPIPYPMDGYPALGLLPLAKAEAVADAYTAVLDRLGADFAYDAKLLADKLRFEHREWQVSLKYGYTMDTVFFFIQG